MGNYNSINGKKIIEERRNRMKMLIIMMMIVFIVFANSNILALASQDDLILQFYNSFEEVKNPNLFKNDSTPQKQMDKLS